MASLEAMSPAEEMLWRALMRIVLTLPRHLHTASVPATGLAASEYTVLVNLSEAPNRQLRMADLATASGLSASRTTRLVDDLQSRGMVAKRSSSSDGRSNLAELTAKGLAKFKAAWPAHLASVRELVLDHIDPETLDNAARTLDAVAARLDRTGARTP